jgi:hypothetical protein
MCARGNAQATIYRQRQRTSHSRETSLKKAEQASHKANKKQHYEKPELIVFSDLADGTHGKTSASREVFTGAGSIGPGS